MRKSYLFVAAGAAVFLCGCPTTKITGTKTVIPAPMEDPVNIAAPTVTTVPGAAEWQAPAVKNEGNTVTQSEFKPMTGVTSSGGIESTGKSRKKAVKGGNAATPGGVYVVQSGDTPERIARKHRVRLSALMAANNLDQQSARRLQVGQKLTIPGGNVKVAVKANKKVAQAVQETSADGKYTVQSGDTPERIARKHRVRLSELLKANNLDQQSARRLQIGQKLTIPGKTATPQVTVQEPPQSDVAEVKKQETTPEVEKQPESVKLPTHQVEPIETDSDDQVIEITEATTAAELAKKYNVSAEAISQKNSGKTEFPKGELIFVPKK